MRDLGPGLKEVIRAQVTFLFGRFRPVGGMTEEEQKAQAAERVEFTERVWGYLKALSAPTHEVIERVREAARHFQQDQRAEKMPTPEQVAARVKDHFSALALSAPCRGCKDMGGWYLFAGEDAPLHRKEDGVIPYPGKVFLCGWHHDAVNWYASREIARGNRRHFLYPPPSCLVPRQHYSTPAGERPDVAAYLDGAKMGPMARWARAFVHEVYGLEIVEVLFDHGAPPQAESFMEV